MNDKESFIKDIEYDIENLIIPAETVIIDLNSDYKCRHDNCNRIKYSNSYCKIHYYRDRKNIDMDKRIRNRSVSPICEECGKETDGKGCWNMCSSCYKKKRRKIIKDKCIEIKGGICSVCGGKFNSCVYDFHHLGNKKEDIGILINKSKLDILWDELAKCILICSNCHRELHFKD